MLTGFDLIIIILYFALLIVIGLFTAKGESSEEFLIGGRAIKTFQSMASVGSSLVGAGMLLSYVALVLTYGAGAIWLFIGYIFGFFIFYRFAEYIYPLSQKYRFYTLPDFFYHRFGKRTGFLSAIVVVLICLGWIAVNFIGGGKIIETYTGFDFNYSTIVVGVIISIYLILGGFKAVVRTDAIQFIGLLVLSVLLIYLLSNYSLQLSPADLNIFHISFGELLSFFLVGVIVPLASAELWQRIYAVESVQTFKKSMIWLAVLLVIVGIVLLFIGLIIRNEIPAANPDTALVDGFSALLPAGLTGLAVVVFYSTIMSSADSYLFAVSSSITQDLFHRKQTDSSVKKSRFWIVVLAILGILIAIFVKEVLGATYFLVALMFALGSVVILSWLFPRISKQMIFYALLFGCLATIGGLLIVDVSELLIAFSIGGVLTGLGVGRLLQ